MLRYMYTASLVPYIHVQGSHKTVILIKFSAICTGLNKSVQHMQAHVTHVAQHAL